MSRALADAARRARFSTRSRALTGGGFSARRGARLARIALLWSFIAMVVAPVLGAAVYYGFIASDQYVAEGQFTVTGGEVRSNDGFGTLTGIPAAAIIQDTQIVTNFVESRAAVEKLEALLGLRKLYSRDAIDTLSRLPSDAPIEKLVRYWKKMIEISIRMPSGIVEFKVRAYTPEDAARIGSTVIDISEQLINEINDHMRRDLVSNSEHEFKRNADRVAAARVALEKARDDDGVLDAGRTGEAFDKLITEARASLLMLQQEFATQARAVSVNSPQMRPLKARIDALKAQIADLEGQVTSTATTDSKTLSATMTKFGALDLERQISERIYAGAAAALELARISAERQVMYLNAFVQPAPPEAPLYPKRILSIFLIALGALSIWGVVVGVVAAARNNMA